MLYPIFKIDRVQVGYKTKNRVQNRKDIKMKKQEIEKIIRIYVDKYKDDFDELIIKLAKNELERFENKPLSLEELKGMIGEPVWVKEESKWFILQEVAPWEDTDEGMAIGINSSEYLDYYDNIFYKHKPKENDDEETKK